MGCGSKDICKDFVQYCHAFVLYNLTATREPALFEDWLLKSNYSLSRQQHMRDLRTRFTTALRQMHVCKSFIKSEPYLEPKNPRIINSPSDLYKSLMGPIVAKADKCLFASKWFVKGSDPKTWPERLLNLFGTRSVFETDFSSMEIHHHAHLAEPFRFWMCHYTRINGFANSLRRAISRLYQGEQYLNFKTKKYAIQACVSDVLMSGALWTSSANGLLNLCLLSYLCARSKCPDALPQWLAQNIDSLFTGLVEGDDGICEAFPLNEQLILGLGLQFQDGNISLKLKSHKSYTDASFCGITCDENGQLIKEPIGVLRKFFQLPMKLVKARRAKMLFYLRCKALSYSWLYHDVPIIGELAYSICKLTSGINGKIPSEMNFCTDSIVKASTSRAMYTPPRVANSARMLVESKYRVPCEYQLQIEQSIRNGPGTWGYLVPCAHLVKKVDVLYSLLMHTEHPLNYEPRPLKTEKIKMHLMPVTHVYDVLKHMEL
jgi:hypothetical protein